MLSTSSYTQKTGVWVLFFSFWVTGFPLVMLLTTPNWLRWCSRAMRVEKMSKFLWSFVFSWQKLLIWNFFAIPKCMCFCFVVWCSLFSSFFGVWIFPFFCFLFLRFHLVMLWQLQIGWDDVLELWGLKRWGSFNDPVLFLCHELLIWSVFCYPYMSLFLHHRLVVSFGCFSKL